MSRIDRLMTFLDDAVLKFWSCPNDHARGQASVNVTWDGDVATCTDCGMTSLDDEILDGDTPRDLTGEKT